MIDGISNLIRVDPFSYVTDAGRECVSDQEEVCGEEGEQVCRAEMLFIEIPLLLLSAGNGGAGGGDKGEVGSGVGGMEAGESAGEAWKTWMGLGARRDEEKVEKNLGKQAGSGGAPCARMGHVMAFDMSPAQVNGSGGGGGGLVNRCGGAGGRGAFAICNCL